MYITRAFFLFLRNLVDCLKKSPKEHNTDEIEYFLFNYVSNISIIKWHLQLYWITLWILLIIFLPTKTTLFFQKYVLKALCWKIVKGPLQLENEIENNDFSRKYNILMIHWAGNPAANDLHMIHKKFLIQHAIEEKWQFSFFSSFFF